jgi:hypothetical protein
MSIVSPNPETFGTMGSSPRDGHFVAAGMATAPLPSLALSQSLAQASARSVKDRCYVREFDRCEIGRDAYPLSHHAGLGITSALTTMAWFAFCVIATIHDFVVGN